MEKKTLLLNAISRKMDIQAHSRQTTALSSTRRPPQKKQRNQLFFCFTRTKSVEWQPFFSAPCCQNGKKWLSLPYRGVSGKNLGREGGRERDFRKYLYIHKRFDFVQHSHRCQERKKKKKRGLEKRPPHTPAQAFLYTVDTHHDDSPPATLTRESLVAPAGDERHGPAVLLHPLLERGRPALFLLLHFLVLQGPTDRSFHLVCV